jgi:hypothetical protein
MTPHLDAALTALGFRGAVLVEGRQGIWTPPHDADVESLSDPAVRATLVRAAKADGLTHVSVELR